MTDAIVVGRIVLTETELALVRRAVKAEQEADIYRQRCKLLERLIAELAAAAANTERVS